MSKSIAQQVHSHPDFTEILVKLSMDMSIKDISSWLKAKYQGQKALMISENSLKVFKEEYLDFYQNVREDLLKTKMALSSSATDDLIMAEVKGSDAYKQKLLDIADKELDIKAIVKKLVVSIEHRSEQVFDQIQNDPRSIKGDKVLIEWFNLLLNTLERFKLIHDGPLEPANINIQNNYNINMIDDRINIFYDVIRECISQLDHESSLLFTDLFTKKIQELKLSEQPQMSQDKQLEAAYRIETRLEPKLTP